MPYDCAPIDSAFLAQGAEVVPFDAAAYGWVNLPTDVKLHRKIDFPDDGGIWEYKSESTGRRFVLWWWSYEPSTAPDGTRNGNHAFCGFYETTKHD
jgi:hypothetical protein